MAKAAAKANAKHEANYDQQIAMQNQLLQKAMQDTPELLSWRHDKADWDKFMAGGDYRNAPKSTSLNFDLWNPAHIQEQTAKMANLEGVGAAAMGGDTSVALQLARERNANEAAQNAGAAYESAVKGQDAYYKGNMMPFMQAENARWGNIFGQQSSNAANAASAWNSSRSIRPWWQGALNAGIQAAGNVAGGYFANRPGS